MTNANHLRAIELLETGAREEIDFLRERRPHHLRRTGDDRTARRILRAGDEGRHVRDAREEDEVQGPLRMLPEQEVVQVRLRDLQGPDAR